MWSLAAAFKVIMLGLKPTAKPQNVQGQSLDLGPGTLRPMPQNMALTPGPSLSLEAPRDHHC
jgi:hypothetical protein